MAKREEVKNGKTSIFAQRLSLKKSGTRYPSKKTINLVRHETEQKNRRSIAYFVVFLIVLVIFVRVAVIGLLNRLNAAEADYNSVKSQLEQVNELNSHYDEVKKQYDEVTDWYMTEEEKTEVDKTGVFAMLKEDLFPYVSVSSVEMTGNQITIQTGPTDLETVAEFIAKMQSDSRNSYVTVTTTGVENSGRERSGNTVSATVSVTYAGGTSGSTSAPAEEGGEE